MREMALKFHKDTLVRLIRAYFTEIGSKLKNRCRRVDWILVIILAVAVFLRFFRLDLRPPHSDEGVNGAFADTLTTQGFYRYDPENYHGPLHYYLLFLFKILIGRNLWGLRFATALFGSLAVWLVADSKRYFGRFVAYTAALFLAVSPGLVFFSRDAIHESDFMFFSILAVLGFVRFKTMADKISLWAMGLGTAGMILSKEVYAFQIPVFFSAVIFLKLSEKLAPSLPAAVPVKKFAPKDVLSAALVSLLCVLLFYSGFFLNWDGVGGFFASFIEWAQTGVGGKGHQKPVYYWADLMFRYEWIGLFGLVLSFRAVEKSGPRWIRFIALYGISVFIAYSFIPYKTPWCLIQALWPFLYWAAFCFSRMVAGSGRRRILAMAALLLLTGAQTARSVEINFFRYADTSIYYTYVPQLVPAMSLYNKLAAIAREDPLKKHLPISVIMKHGWPMPWLLGRFTKTGYYESAMRSPGDAAVIFCDPLQRKPLETYLQEEYLVIPSHFRNPRDADLLVYFNRDLFGKYFDPGAEVFKPVPERDPLPGQGLTAKVYGNAEWKGNPILQKKYPKINLRWTDAERPWPAPLGIILEGQIFIPVDGEVAFYLQSDDGSALEIDGQLLANNLGPHSDRTVGGKMNFKQGWYPIRLRYNDVGGAGLLHLWWKLPGGEEENIPAANLKIPE
jgi:uncharacterized protein (TIGR03663 family)